MSDTDELKDTDQIFMEELKQEFKERVAVNLKEMSELFRGNNLDEIARIAHDIKGTSGIFGLDQGTEIAKHLQNAAQNKMVKKTQEFLQQLIDYMRENEIIS